MHASRWKTARSLMVAAVLPLALACEPAGEQDAGMDQPGQTEQTDGMEQQQQQTQQEPMGQSETVQLTAMGDASVSGDVQLSREGNDLSVEIMASMGGPGDYPAHIHEGTCDEPGGVAIPLDSPTAQEEGIAEGTTQVDATQLEAGNSYLVMIHQQQGAPAGCAEIPSSLLEG